MLDSQEIQSLESVFGCRCLRTSLKWKNCRAQHVMAMTQTLKNHNKMILIHGPWFDFQCSKCTIKTAAGSIRRQGNVNRTCDQDVINLCKQGRLNEALHILHDIDKPLDTSTYASVLQLCIKRKALLEGKLVHTHINEIGFTPDRCLRNTLVNMYAKCGSLVDARRVFDEMPKRDVISWTAMIATYSGHRYAEEALKLFNQMQLTGIQPNQFTLASVLPACAKSEAMEGGTEIHEEIIRRGFQTDVFVANALVDMYAKCGSIENARNLFDKIPQRDVVSWNTMIAGYTQSGDVDEALKLFQEMPERNVVSWTSLIGGYVQNGQSVEALQLFRQMQLTGVKPKPNTFVTVLSACADLAALEQGMEIHDDIIKNGFMSEVFVNNSLIDMYAKCGSIKKAHDVFDKMHQRDVISWTAIIGGYAMHGCGKEALKLFEQMQHSGQKPDHITLVCVLSACCHAGLVKEGRQDCYSQFLARMVDQYAI